MKITRKYLRAACLGLSLSVWLVLSASCARAVEPLTSVLHDLQGAGWDAVEMAARDQASNDGPRFRSAPAQVPFYETFEGDWTPQDVASKLAIFSDDGCNVFVDGVKVLANKDKGQALPDLSQSLHKVPFVFQAGRSYRIKVEFSNTVYEGRSDIDGATLFAYTEESITVPPTPTPASQGDSDTKAHCDARGYGHASGDSDTKRNGNSSSDNCAHSDTNSSRGVGHDAYLQGQQRAAWGGD